MRKLLIAGLIFLLISSLTIFLTAQVQSQEGEISVQENNELSESEVELTADLVNYDKENNLMVFTGNVVIIQEKIKIAKVITYIMVFESFVQNV